MQLHSATDFARCVNNGRTVVWAVKGCRVVSYVVVDTASVRGNGTILPIEALLSARPVFTLECEAKNRLGARV